MEIKKSNVQPGSFLKLSSFLLTIFFIAIACSNTVLRGKLTSCPLNGNCEYAYTESIDLDPGQRKTHGDHRIFRFTKTNTVVFSNRECRISSSIIVKAPEKGRKFYLTGKDIQGGGVMRADGSACVDVFGSPQPVAGYVKGVRVAKGKNANWLLDINLVFKKENSKTFDTLKVIQYFAPGKL